MSGFFIEKKTEISDIFIKIPGGNNPSGCCPLEVKLALLI
jgi:hypothetical protein